jgi:hypothetical protein
MLDVFAQHDVEVAWSGDQNVVEAFAAQGADEPFRDRIRAGRPDRGADDPDVGTGEDRVEGGGELAVPVAKAIARIGDPGTTTVRGRSWTPPGRNSCTRRPSKRWVARRWTR